jgi:insulysin
MVDFYTHYISTSSSQRAKLSVHLQAQAKAQEPSLEEKKASAIASLKVILAEHKLTPNDKALQSRIDNASSTEAIADAVATYLTEDLKTDKDLADKILDEAKAALGVADSGLPAEPQALDESADVQSVVDATHPVLIKDVHAWKASMQLSTGVRPVRNLEEFVEVAEKL